MKVKDVITSALRLIGRSELISDLSDPSLSEEEDAAEVIETLLYCFNAVEDELSRKYIPLSTSEELRSSDNKFYYSNFSQNPVKIKRVTVNGNKADFEIYTKFMVVKGNKIKVDYEYSPRRKTLDGDSEYGDEVGEYLIALGMAAEYAAINGEAEASDRWEKQYRIQLDGVQRTLAVCAKIPPRRWV